MIQKRVNIANVKTMVDGSIRITIDLLSGDGEDFKSVFNMMKEDTVMILVNSETLREANTVDVNPVILEDSE